MGEIFEEIVNYFNLEWRGLNEIFKEGTDVFFLQWVKGLEGDCYFEIEIFCLKMSLNNYCQNDCCLLPENGHIFASTTRG